MNRRMDIRSYVIKVLKDRDIADGNVIATRVIPITEDELPVVVVSIESESTASVSRAGAACEKVSQLAIEILHNAQELDAEGYVDRLSANIERILCEDESLGNSVNRTELKQTQLTIVKDGDLPLAVARMVYEISYYSSLEGNYAELPELTGGSFQWTN